MPKSDKSGGRSDDKTKTKGKPMNSKIGTGKAAIIEADKDNSVVLLKQSVNVWHSEGAGAVLRKNGASVQLENQLSHLGITKLTNVQVMTVEKLIRGDSHLKASMFLRSPTGTGKTLAIQIPLVDYLLKLGSSMREGPVKFTRASGCFVLYMCPTLEICYQSHQQLQALLKPFPFIVTAYVHGDQNSASVNRTINKGVNVMISTPVKMQDLLSSKPVLREKCRLLIVDEADRLLEDKFGDAMQRVIDMLSVSLTASVTQSQGMGVKKSKLHDDLLEYDKDTRRAILQAEKVAKINRASEAALTTATTATSDLDNEETRKKEGNFQLWLFSATLTKRFRKFIKKIDKKKRWIKIENDCNLTTTNTRFNDDSAAAAVSGGSNDEKERRLASSVPSNICQMLVCVNEKEWLLSLIMLVLLFSKNYRHLNRRVLGFRGLIIVPSNEVAEYVSALLGNLVWPSDDDDYDGLDGDDDLKDYGKDTFTSIASKGGRGGKASGANRDRKIVFPDNAYTIYKLHGKLPAEEREQVLTDFNLPCKHDSFSKLVIASDVACRGLDFPDLNAVFNWHFPSSTEDYIHRAGRCGRLGNAGISLQCILPQNKELFQNLMNKTGIVEKFIESASAIKLFKATLIGSSSLPLLLTSELIWKTVLSTDSFKHVINPILPPGMYSSSLLSSLDRYFLNRFTDQIEKHKFLLPKAEAAFLTFLRTMRSIKDLTMKSVFDFSEVHSGHLAGGFFVKTSPKQIIRQQQDEHAKNRGRN